MVGQVSEIRPNAYYTLEEAAAMLRVSPRHVRRLLENGFARGVKIGRHWRVLGRDLLELHRTDELTDANWSQALMRLSERSFREVWDNEADSVYDDV